MKAITSWIKAHAKSLIVIVITAGLFFVFIVTRQGAAPEGEILVSLTRGPIIESVYGIGTVTAAKSYQLKAGVTSTVRKLYVNEGKRVNRGDRLINLDGIDFTAPFDGVITYLPAKTGETVFAQSVVLSVVDLTDRYITVSLEQRGALRVRQGQKARISFDSLRGESFGGIVESIYSNESNFLVRIGVTTLPTQILPGMTGDVAIVINKRDDVLLVPVAAINAGKVKIKRGRKKTELMAIKTGVVDGEMAEVLSDNLKEGDRVYISGNTRS